MKFPELTFPRDSIACVPAAVYSNIHSFAIKDEMRNTGPYLLWVYVLSVRNLKKKKQCDKTDFYKEHARKYPQKSLWMINIRKLELDFIQICGIF